VRGVVQLVAGLDGCPGGWVLVETPADGDGRTTVERVSNLDGVIAGLDSGRLVATAIDIPIGLPEAGSRRCDIEARRMIGARKSSVFPAPARGVLGSATYDDAADRSQTIAGKRLSRQAFGILSKIEEVDRVMTPERQRQFVEVHPEVSFTVLAGVPMSHHKSTVEGRAERLAALRGSFPGGDSQAAHRIARVRPDDVLDAFVAAWSARRWLARSHVQLGGDVDQRGLRMEMIA
jgi:predicted RNase H-like nuclease